MSGVNDMVEGTFYLTLSKKRGWMSRLATPKISIRKPSIPTGHIAMRLNFSIPEALFQQFIPEGTVTLPADADIGRPEIEVSVPADITVTPDVKLQLVEFESEEPDGEF